MVSSASSPTGLWTATQVQFTWDLVDAGEVCRITRYGWRARGVPSRHSDACPPSHSTSETLKPSRASLTKPTAGLPENATCPSQLSTSLKTLPSRSETPTAPALSLSIHTSGSAFNRRRFAVNMPLTSMTPLSNDERSESLSRRSVSCSLVWLSASLSPKIGQSRMSFNGSTQSWPYRKDGRQISSASVSVRINDGFRLASQLPRIVLMSCERGSSRASPLSSDTF